MGRQARISADEHSSKYFAERVLDVYRIAIGITNDEEPPLKKNFFQRLKDVVKKGFHG